MKATLLAAALAAACLLTACGGSDEQDEDATKSIDPPHCSASAASCI